jgi:hypothetical protein
LIPGAGYNKNWRQVGRMQETVLQRLRYGKERQPISCNMDKCQERCTYCLGFLGLIVGCSVIWIQISAVPIQPTLVKFSIMNSVLVSK